MKKITQEQLNEVLRLHKLWLKDPQQGKKADLSRSDLSDANLSYTNLSHAILLGANLLGSNLSGSNLSGHDLLNALFSKC